MTNMKLFIAWNSSSTTHHARRRTQGLSERGSSCIWSECNARPSSATHRPCRQWCTLVVQIHYKLSLIPLNRNNRRRSSHPREFSAAMSPSRCGCIQSFGERRLRKSKNLLNLPWTDWSSTSPGSNSSIIKVWWVWHPGWKSKKIIWRSHQRRCADRSFIMSQ